MSIFRRKKFKVGDRVMVTSLFRRAAVLSDRPGSPGPLAGREAVGLRGTVVRAGLVTRNTGYGYCVRLSGGYAYFYEWELRHAD